MYRCYIPAWWASAAAVTWQYISAALCRWSVYWWEWPTHLSSHLSVCYSHVFWNESDNQNGYFWFVTTGMRTSPDCFENGSLIWMKREQAEAWGEHCTVVKAVFCIPMLQKNFCERFFSFLCRRMLVLNFGLYRKLDNYTKDSRQDSSVYQ